MTALKSCGAIDDFVSACPAECEKNRLLRRAFLQTLAAL
jgi:hypothetical protein